MSVTQYKITFDDQGPLPQRAAYALYAALLDSAPRSYGEALHETGFTPVAQHLRGRCWTVNLLDAGAERFLSPVLEQRTEYRLWGAEQPLVVRSRSVTRVTEAEDFLKEPPLQQGTLVLRSPTAFRSEGSYQLLPTQRLVMQSLLNRWNETFPEFGIDYQGGGLEHLASVLQYTGVQLESTGYEIKRRSIPGVMGKLRFRLEGDEFPVLLCGALLRFGGFSGIGIKTALGMGGVAIETK